MVVKAAEADAEAKFLAGTGIARQRQAIINGLRESVMHFQQDIGDVNSKDVMEMMMMTQYFDTMKDMGTHGNNSTIFVPRDPAPSPTPPRPSEWASCRGTPRTSADEPREREERARPLAHRLARARATARM